MIIHRFAKGRLHRRVPGQMTRLEMRYRDRLETLKLSGEIVLWRYESVRLKLAPSTYYEPDFYVLYPDGLIELCEVKGSWDAPNQDKSRVKLKVAAELYSEFRFVAITEVRRGEFVREEIGLASARDGERTNENA